MKGNISSNSELSAHRRVASRDYDEFGLFLFQIATRLIKRFIIELRVELAEASDASNG